MAYRPVWGSNTPENGRETPTPIEDKVKRQMRPAPERAHDYAGSGHHSDAPPAKADDDARDSVGEGRAGWQVCHSFDVEQTRGPRQVGDSARRQRPALLVGRKQRV